MPAAGPRQPVTDLSLRPCRKDLRRLRPRERRRQPGHQRVRAWPQRPAGQRVRQRGLVHHGTPRGVDQDGAGLQLREALGRDKDRIDKLWLIVDDQPVRAETLQAMNAGDPVTVLRVPREALAQWLQPQAGGALERHFYIVDPLGNWMMRAPAEADAPKLRRDLEKLMRGSAGWDNAGRP